MTDDSQVEMDDSECDELLEATDTGVLSLSSPADDPPHSIPVSVGYDAVESVLYFRLAEDTDSEKGELDGRAVSFVAYGRADETGDWRSVIAHGELERTTNEEIAVETLEGLERVTIPLVDIFGEPTSDIDFGFFRLVPDSLTGRKEEPMGD
jgi:nitroimidazol reductase NimA-like FMN-containing flavoprotein (pyridoxamine 5'-phosphate oxidase superfamily)